MISERNKGRILIISAALLWGLAGVCVKSIPWNSMSIMASRCFITIIILGITKKDFRIHFTKKSALGGIMGSLCGVLYMMSIKMTTAATAIVLQYIAPILVFLYTVFVQKIKPKIYEAVIVFIVFGGCFLSFAGDLDPTKIIGNILGLASGFAFASQIIIFSDKNTDSAEGLYIGNIFSFIVCVPFMFFDNNLEFTPRIIFWVLVLGIFQYGLANVCYSKGCTLLNKVETSLLLTIEPIFNPIPVWLVTGETMKPLSFVGFLVVITGIVLYAALPVLTRKRESFS